MSICSLVRRLKQTQHQLDIRATQWASEVLLFNLLHTTKTEGFMCASPGVRESRDPRVPGSASPGVHDTDSSPPLIFHFLCSHICAKRNVKLQLSN